MPLSWACPRCTARWRGRTRAPRGGDERAGRWRPGTLTGPPRPPPPPVAQEPLLPSMPPTRPLLFNLLRTPSASPPAAPLQAPPGPAHFCPALSQTHEHSIRGRRKLLVTAGGQDGKHAQPRFSRGPGAGWAGRGWKAGSRGQQGNHRPWVLWARSRLEGEIEGSAKESVIKMNYHLTQCLKNKLADCGPHASCLCLPAELCGPNIQRRFCPGPS